tara:strand:- start:5092 stop:5487 length:396 start_codon:yes stop_codon:yes gene_type:complete
MAAAGISVKLPLSMGDFGYELNENYTDAIKQNFKNLLLTSPGERVMDLNFGVGLRRILFEPDSTSTRLDIYSSINKQVEIYMPFLEIVDINFSTPETNVFESDENSFFVVVIYRISSLKIQDQLDISLKSN